jgi:hypothetical protein
MLSEKTSLIDVTQLQRFGYCKGKPRGTIAYRFLKVINDREDVPLTIRRHAILFSYNLPDPLHCEIFDCMLSELPYTVGFIFLRFFRIWSATCCSFNDTKITACVSVKVLMNLFSTDRLRSIKHYEIVVPRRVNAHGLPYPAEEHYSRHRRRKRDSTSSFPVAADDAAETKLYSLSAFGRQMTLRLGPTNGAEFIGRGLVVQHMADNVTWLGTTLSDSDHCFRRGSIDGDESSIVVLSTCDSLVSESNALK